MNMMNLPDIDTKRWSSRKKRQVVNAINDNRITFKDAAHIYQISDEELQGWLDQFNSNGIDELKATLAQINRRWVAI